MCWGLGRRGLAALHRGLRAAEETRLRAVACRGLQSCVVQRGPSPGGSRGRAERRALQGVRGHGACHPANPQESREAGVPLGLSAGGEAAQQRGPQLGSEPRHWPPAPALLCGLREAAAAARMRAGPPTWSACALPLRFCPPPGGSSGVDPSVGFPTPPGVQEPDWKPSVLSVTGSLHPQELEDLADTQALLAEKGATGGEPSDPWLTPEPGGLRVRPRESCGRDGAGRRRAGAEVPAAVPQG